MAVRQEVNNLERSVVVQELEFAINRALCFLLSSLGNQYKVGSSSWPSLTLTANCWMINRSLTTDLSSIKAFVPPSYCLRILT